jgi:hypothetical protein
MNYVLVGMARWNKALTQVYKLKPVIREDTEPSSYNYNEK